MKVFDHTSQTLDIVGKAALQHTYDGFSDMESRCKCEGSKLLKFKWVNNSAPSFFWGCGRYRANEMFLHDRTKPQHSKLTEINRKYLHYISDKDLRGLLHQVEDEEKKNEDNTNLTEDENALVADIFGPLPEDVTIKEHIHSFVDCLSREVKERESKLQMGLESTSMAM